MKITELYKIYLNHPIISTDSRNIKKDSIFISLKGDNFNGNKYAEQAIKNGSKYAIIDDSSFKKNNNYLLVKDGLKCLQDLAKYHRDQLSIPIIAITGTNGKTTSKELINSCLSTELKTVATKGNFNNHIGVPLTILGIKKEHQIAIIEMGANHEKEISFLCEIAKPNYGTITNIGRAHLEGFKDIKGVKKTKKELYDYIYKENGKIFINNNDNVLNDISKNINSISYGQKGSTTGAIKCSNPFISVLYNEIEISTNLIGEYQFENIMLAICVANYFKIDKRNIKKAISEYRPDNNRSQVIQTTTNTVILDAYNANPSSMEKMIESFSKIKEQNKVCILGEMGELGKFSKKEHISIIDLVKNLNLTTFFIGKEFVNLKQSNSFLTVEHFNQYIEKNSIKNSTILLKGSRSVALEKVIKQL
jgi:UDP-N-acetylmuramoyl-tripeptide--D-alanyl-D-alanine ligase